MHVAHGVGVTQVSGWGVSVSGWGGHPGLARAPRAFHLQEGGRQRGRKGSLRAAGAGSPGVLTVPRAPPRTPACWDRWDSRRRA